MKPPASPTTARRTRQRGQSLVEFALMWVAIVWLLMGLLDLGRVFFYYLALRDAAGEGAYYGSIHPTWATSADNPDPENITYRVKNSAPGGGLVDLTGASVTVSTPGGTGVGNTVTVSVSTNYTLLTPLVNTIVGSSTLPLSTSASAKILTVGP